MFRIGQARFLAPDEILEVVVGFDREPLKEELIGRIKAWKFVLRGSVIYPVNLSGRHVFGFFNSPVDGTLGKGSRLAEAARAMLGRDLAEKETLDLNTIFASRYARVRLKRVEPRGGGDPYDVIEKVLGPFQEGRRP